MKQLIAIMAVVAFIGTTSQVLQAQHVLVGTQVQAGKQVSIERIDHSPWNGLLKKYVNETGHIDYSGLKNSQADMKVLDNYLASLSSASRTKAASREHQLAFWINAYNALTVKGILREYPTTTIRNHTDENGGYNVWKHLLLPVGSSQISLDAIEHQVLRKMSEPRIHFAIVCASHSCPRLLNQAYVAENLENQLTLNTKNFFANTENFQYNAATNQIKISAIMQWFATDFGANQAAQLNFIAPYLPTQEAYKAAKQNTASVSHLEYSWALNVQTAAMVKAAKMKMKSQMTGAEKTGSQSKGSMSKESKMEKTGGSGGR